MIPHDITIGKITTLDELHFRRFKINSFEIAGPFFGPEKMHWIRKSDFGPLNFFEIYYHVSKSAMFVTKTNYSISDRKSRNWPDTT